LSVLFVEFKIVFWIKSHFGGALYML